MSVTREQRNQGLPSFDDLHHQHQGHEKRLEELKQKPWLSPEEELEEKTLKKLKLHLKDQMEEFRRSAS